MELGQGPDLDKDIEKYQCCGKQFTTLRGLKIHQGKACRKKREVQQRRLHSHETSGERKVLDLKSITSQHQDRTKKYCPAD